MSARGVLFITVALVVIVAGLAWGTQDARVDSVTITHGRIEHGLVMNGTLALTNPGHVPVPIRSVAYTVSSDGGVLATGNLGSFVLKPGSSEANATIRLDERALAALVSTRSSVLTINGTITLGIPFTQPIPWKTSYDAAPALRNATQGALAAIAELVGGASS